MKDIKSLPSIEQVNITNYLEVLRKLDPELYLIKIALTESGVNPMLVPPYIRAVGNLIYGSGYGKIQVFMQARRITQIKGEESVEVNEEASIEV